ncbi:T-cell receptor alpha chain V region RL-5 [Pelobates cultripes]|nr:T-cell receptor alpha chain V region RL-5 [Pelobates cultripes]
MKLWLTLLLLICATGFSSSDKVTQTQSEIIAAEGSLAPFYCKYETQYSNPDLFWYVHQPGKAPRSIIWRTEYSKVEPEPGTRYASKLDKETTSIYLNISDVTVSDSGVYYCALRPTVSVSADCTVQEALTHG